jgi:hypothetical protein
MRVVTDIIVVVCHDSSAKSPKYNTWVTLLKFKEKILGSIDPFKVYLLILYINLQSKRTIRPTASIFKLRTSPKPDDISTASANSRKSPPLRAPASEKFLAPSHVINTLCVINRENPHNKAVSPSPPSAAPNYSISSGVPWRRIQHHVVRLQLGAGQETVGAGTTLHASADLAGPRYEFEGGYTCTTATKTKTVVV